MRRVWLLLAALTAGCVEQAPTLSTTTVTPPPSLGVDPCPLNVPTETTAVVPAGGESRTVDVITGESCSWMAESRASFIAITPASGRGSGTVTVTVQANTGAARTGSVVVNNLTLTVSQAALPCAFALSPTSQSFSRDGGSGTVGVIVTQGVDCQWTAASNASFISLTSGSGGTGSGSVTYRVESNGGPARSGTLTIAGITFAVNQAEFPPDPPPPPNPPDPDGLTIARARPWIYFLGSRLSAT